MFTSPPTSPSDPLLLFLAFTFSVSSRSPSLHCISLTLFLRPSFFLPLDPLLLLAIPAAPHFFPSLIDIRDTCNMYAIWSNQIYRRNIYRIALGRRTFPQKRKTHTHSNNKIDKILTACPDMNLIYVCVYVCACALTCVFVKCHSNKCDTTIDTSSFACILGWKYENHEKWSALITFFSMIFMIPSTLRKNTNIILTYSGDNRNGACVWSNIQWYILLAIAIFLNYSPFFIDYPYILHIIRAYHGTKNCPLVGRTSIFLRCMRIAEVRWRTTRPKWTCQQERCQ